MKGVFSVKNKLINSIIVLFILISLSLCTGAANKNKLVENITAAYEKQWEGIQDITILTEDTVTYQKRIEGTKQWKMRLKTEVNGMKIISIYDGQYFWQTNPMSGQMEKSEVNFNPHDPFYELLQGNNLKYMRTEGSAGQEYYIFKIVEEAAQKIFKLQSQQDMGDIIVDGKIWIDSNNYYLKKMEMKVEFSNMGGYSFEQIIENKDFKKIKNMWVPYYTVITVGGKKTETRVQEVKINQKLAATLFVGKK